MKIHVVEDDKVYNKLIERSIASISDVEIETFYNGNLFFSHLHDNPDIVTLDLGLPDYSGLEILKEIKKYNSNIEVIIISGQDSISASVELVKEGAYDYITKDENIKDRIITCVNNIKHKKDLMLEISQLKNEISKKYNFGAGIIGESAALKNVLSLIDRAINIPNINVSICGETGTGKELIAKTIHYNSLRKNDPFIPVNMGAIPKEHIETELFGYVKGAFSTAIMPKKGKFEEASNGTIFLDEIGELDLNLQVKLLRVIQDREITRVGSNKAIKVKCRIITATNKDLLHEVNTKNFREDLYYRLLGLPIHMPALKDRKNDIILLSQYFLSSFCEDNQIDEKLFTSQAKKKLMSYTYPGNVRELKAIVELSVVMATGMKIEEDNIILNSTNSELDILCEEMTLKEYNERIIRHFLRMHNNNVLRVAKKLDIGKSTIYNMIKRDKQLEELN